MPNQDHNQESNKTVNVAYAVSGCAALWAKYAFMAVLILAGFACMAAMCHCAGSGGGGSDTSMISSDDDTEQGDDADDDTVGGPPYPGQKDFCEEWSEGDYALDKPC